MTNYYPSWDPNNPLVLDPGFATQPGANGRQMTPWGGSPYQTAQYTTPKAPQPTQYDMSQVASQPLTREGADPTYDSPPQAFDPRDAFMQAIMRPFQFDPSQVDTSMFDKMLQTKQQQIQNAHDLAQNNFNVSNKNLGDMYSAFQNHLQSQLPGIQQRYAQANQNTAATFDKGTQQNNDWLNNYNNQKTEMLQRLGIQAAANAPDLVGNSIAQGNNALNESKNSRLALNDADSQRQQDWFQNMNAMAGNEGMQRQQDLQRSLNNIFNNLDNANLQAQTENDQNKMDWVKQMYGTAFQNYQNERDFNEKALENYNQLMLQQPKYDAQTALAQARAMAAQANLQKTGNSGIIGLNNAFDPSVSQAFQTMVGQGKDPSQVPQFYSAFKNDPSMQNVDPSAFFQYLNSYNNMGKVNNFPLDISIDPTN